MSINSALNYISSSRKRQITFLVFAFLTLVIMVAIFCFSAQDAEKSDKLGLSVNDAINKGIDKITVSVSQETKADIKTTVANYLRKSAHVVLFASLGFCLCGAFLALEWPKSKLLKLAFSFGIGVLYAVTDEVHQLFVKERSGELFDVFIDSAGVISGILIMLLAFGIYVFLRNKKQKAV